MRKLKMGYIGCGFVAQKVHIPNIISLQDECELVAIAEVRTELGKKVQQRWGLPTLYENHLQLAEDDSIEAVALSGHFANQGEIAIDLLKAGKNVFLEKPMAISVEQGERILEAEQLGGARLMIAYMKRFDAGNLLAKRIIDEYRDSGKLGNLRYIRNCGIVGEWIGGLDTPLESTDEPMPDPKCPWPSWLPEEHQKGYINYLQQYTHNVNLLRWLTDSGADVKVKTAVIDPIDGVSGVVVLEVAGITSIIESGRVKAHEWNEHTQLYFEGGWVRCNSPVLLLRNVPASVEVYEGNTPDKQQKNLFPENGRTWPYKEEMKHFIEAIKNNTPFRSPASDAINDVRVLEEIYKKHISNLEVSR